MYVVIVVGHMTDEQYAQSATLVNIKTINIIVMQTRN